MRSVVFALVLLSVTAPAMADDSGKAAFDILGEYETEVRKKNFIKLQSSIDLADAKVIDTKISEVYGEPKVTRAGLKVWEVKNMEASGPKQTTIMCGPDGNGGIIISADRRRPLGAGANTKSKRGTEKRKTRRARQPSTSSSPSSKSTLRSEERD